MRAWLAFLALAACSSTPAKNPVGVDSDRTIVKKPGPETFTKGYLFAQVGENTIGPFFSRRGSGPGAAGLAAWVTVAEGSQRRVLVVPVGPEGTPRGSESTVANVLLDTTMLIVRPMRGKMPGFLIAWISLTDRGKSLWAVAVDDKGAARAKPVELARSNDDIVWIDIIPTDHGATCIWAEETRGSDANLLAAPLDNDGKVRGAITRVATGVTGWHALEVPQGVALSTVKTGGALTLHRLDDDAHATAPPLTVLKTSVSGDVEVVRGNGDQLIFAWTDRSADEPFVSIATVDPKGHPQTQTRKLVEARGGASLLALTHGPAGTAVMFESPVRRKSDSKRVHVAHVSEALALDPKPVSLEVLGKARPELAATSTGFAVLATTADCELDSPTCPAANTVATVHRTDAKMTVIQREPLTFLTDPASLGWGMTCEGESCFALTASATAGEPSRIRTVGIFPRINAKPPAPPAAPPADAPRLLDLVAVGGGESVHDLAIAGNLIATLSGTPGGGKKAAGLTINVHQLADNGSVSTPIAITNKALSVGGVAIAQAGTPEEGGAIAWVARENGDPEVHVTRIDKRGKRTNDLQLTTTKGDASDVTITWTPGGWIVAWVDGRHGNGEVYATKVTTDLKRIAREERITNAPGDASDLVAIAHDNLVWLSWADSRESPRDNLADIYVTAVKPADAKRAVDEHRLLATAAHSRTPHLSTTKDGVVVAWIEEAPLGSETPDMSGYGAFLSRLDAAGKPAKLPTRIPLAGDGTATSVVIDNTSAGGLRAVVARSTLDAILLDGIDLSTPTPRTGQLLQLDGPPSLDVALVLDRGFLWFNDEGPKPADSRARRGKLAWAK